MKQSNIKLKSLVVALSLSSFLVAIPAFSAVLAGAETVESIYGKKPFIPYVHVKSSTGLLEVGTMLEIVKPTDSQYQAFQDWDQATFITDPLTGRNGKTMIFVDTDKDVDTRTDRKAGDKFTTQWYRIPVATAQTLGPITEIKTSDGWQLLLNDAGTDNYTIKPSDINYQIGVIFVPMTAKGDPDRNDPLHIVNVLEYAGQKVDPSNPDGDLDPVTPTIPGGPNPDITPPVNAPGVDPSNNVPLRVVIHTNATYHQAYLNHIADPTNTAAPDFSTVLDSEIVADGRDTNAAILAADNKLRPNTTYYTTVLTTDATTFNKTDFDLDVTDAFDDYIVWSYVDSSGAYAIENDGSTTFRTLRDSNVTPTGTAIGDIDGSDFAANGASSIANNVGSVEDRVKAEDRANLPTAANMDVASPTSGLNEQGFKLKVEIDDAP